jgi:hypothetical protein
MGWCIKLSLALFVGILLSFSNVSFVTAQEIKYSIAPHCDENNQVTCKNNEQAVCIKLGSLTQSEEDLHYIPGCDFGSARCIDEATRSAAPEDVVIECVEFTQCQGNIAYCSDGKTVKCLGDDNELDGCNCEDGSDPICDYTWQVSNSGAYD